MEYIYKLTLIGRLFVKGNWQPEDEKILSEHFEHLTTLKDKGNLIMAGKTAGLDLDTYGLVIFAAESLEEAKSIMKNDPAIKKGIMKGHLHEYNVSLFNNKYKKE